MKILYAASNSGSELRVLRFLEAVKKENYQIKVAGYQQNFVKINIDWNLSSLLNLFDSRINFESDNFKTYFEQVKYFNPDLIISDMEVYTSHIAKLLNIKIWQVSPLLLKHALPHKLKFISNVYKYYSALSQIDRSLDNIIKNIICNADKNFIYSHFGDLDFLPEINPSFEWLRPYYLSDKESLPCKHHMIAALLKNNKNIIDYLKKYQDVVVFSPFSDEEYQHVIIKNIYDNIELGCNIKNCDLFASMGETDFLADAFYNQKFSLIFPNFNNLESISNALYTEHFGLGKVIYNTRTTFLEDRVEKMYNNDIKFLHQKIKEL